MPFTGGTLPGTVGLPFWQSWPVQELEVDVVVVVVVLVVSPLRPAPPDPDPEPDPVASDVVVLDPAVVVSPPAGEVAVPTVGVLAESVLVE